MGLGGAACFAVSAVQLAMAAEVPARVLQDPQDITVTAGTAHPTDLTGQMAAGLVSSAMALFCCQTDANGECSCLIDQAAAFKALNVAERLYNVTMNTRGVATHPRELWKSDSFFDDRAWAVRHLWTPISLGMQM